MAISCSPPATASSRCSGRPSPMRTILNVRCTRRYSAKLVADGGTPLEARVGVNTGEVVVRTLTTADGHTEYTPIGHTANLASRMQAIAPTGSNRDYRAYSQAGPRLLSA